MAAAFKALVMAASRNATLSDGPLGRLLAATKLGTERKHLLRWLAAPPPLILRPRTLLFGSPNPGFTNQVFALVGCIVLANLTRARLVLPALSASADSSIGHAFGDAFDARAFAKAMRRTVDVVDVTDSLQASMASPRLASKSTKSSSSAFALGSDRGWFVYKASEIELPERLRRIELEAV